MRASSETKPAMPLAFLDAFTERIPDNVLLEPIEYIFADHCRLAAMCDALKAYGAASYSEPDLAAAVLLCLQRDLPLHTADEETNLVPLLKARARHEDHFTDVQSRMDDMRKHDGALVDEICDGLGRGVRGDASRCSAAFNRTIDTFATRLRRYLNWENAVVLPLARKRLSAHDLEAMGRAMAARRSITYPGPDLGPHPDTLDAGHLG